ncbi:hypothetical protein SteCoe_14260 [Stentor coeruleus]|uniref:Uncharacterized protein n=1 Tax=Stentor coeruleus TaxID=5963 RepID=A0A1R2C6G1_9CILI|nr:hypothetical protein SteCoe_14260 [Stentor coeruleus]
MIADYMYLALFIVPNSAFTSNFVQRFISHRKGVIFGFGFNIIKILSILKKISKKGMDSYLFPGVHIYKALQNFYEYSPLWWIYLIYSFFVLCKIFHERSLNSLSIFLACLLGIQIALLFFIISIIDESLVCLILTILEVLLCLGWINYKYPGFYLSFSDSCVLIAVGYGTYTFFKTIEDEIFCVMLSYAIGIASVFVLCFGLTIGTSYMIYLENLVILKKKYVRNYYRKLAWVTCALVISFSEVWILCYVFNCCGIANKLAFVLQMAIFSAVCMLHMEKGEVGDILVNILSCLLGYFSFEWIFKVISSIN